MEKGLVSLNILNRGFKSVIRQRFKTGLFLIIVIILSSVASGAFLVANAISSTTTHLRRSMPAIVTIGEDDEAIEAMGYTLNERRQGYASYLLEWISREIIYEISILPYVRDFDYTATSSIVYSFDFERYIPENHSNWTADDEGVERNYVTLSGVSRSNFSQIAEGFWEIVSGRTFLEEEMIPNHLNDLAPLLISNGVADVNNLSIGSRVKLYIRSFELPEDAVVPIGGFIDLELEEVWEHPYNVIRDRGFEFEVVGIFDIPYEPFNDWDLFSIELFAQNQFIVPTWLVDKINQIDFDSHMEWASVFNQLLGEQEIEQWQKSLNMIDPTWILYDSSYFDAFQLAANELLPEFNIVEDLSFRHKYAIASMENINLIANQVLIFTTGATLVVLMLVILLYLRDRTYEIGIYLALGESKIKIIFQILFELLSVAAIGVAISIFIGNMLSTGMSESLLRDAFTQHQLESCPLYICWEPISNFAFRGFGSGQMEIAELVEIFDISLDMQTIATFYAIGLLIMILSTIVPVVYVLELQPKKILMQGCIG